MMFEMLNMWKHVPWLKELRVNIDYACQFIQCISPWWILDKNKNNKKWEKNEINILKIEIEHKIDNKYFDVC